MTDKLISIGKAAEKLGVSIQTLRYWEEKGDLIPERTPSGHRRYSLNKINQLANFQEETNRLTSNQAIIYARVSTRKQAESGNLDRQVIRLTEYAIQKGYQISNIYKDVASGLNENRSGLAHVLKDIKDQKASIVLIEYKDRLARFGFSYLEHHIEDLGGSIEIIEEQIKNEEQELVDDLIAITTSFSARIYGKRGGKTVSKKIEDVLKEGEKSEKQSTTESDPCDKRTKTTTS